MKQIAPEFGEVFSPDEVAPVIGTDTSDIDGNFPVQWISTGLPSVIIPLKNLEAVKRVRINMDLYPSFIERIGKALILVFCGETVEAGNHIHDRVLVPCYGIEEDPATGSANGCLAGYLARYRFFGGPSIENIKVEQGYQVNRPSLLMLAAEDKGKDVDVHVGGKVILTACGTLL